MRVVDTRSLWSTSSCIIKQFSLNICEVFLGAGVRKIQLSNLFLFKVEFIDKMSHISTSAVLKTLKRKKASLVMWAMMDTEWQNFSNKSYFKKHTVNKMPNSALVSGFDWQLVLEEISTTMRSKRRKSHTKYYFLNVNRINTF